VRISDEYDYIVLMDPLDGSLNYTLGIPAVSVSIVFYTPQKPFITEAIAGAVANVFTRETVSFDAEHVYLNHGLIEKYEARSGGVAVVYTRDPSVFTTIYRFMSEHVKGPHRLRILGSAALESVYAGLGRIALFFHNTGRLRNLDVAGGIAIAQRLGASVFDLEGEGLRYRADRIEFLKSLVIGGEEVHLIKKYFASQ
jgi:myo-inositol-1(or 4)-monophosphatase